MRSQTDRRFEPSDEPGDLGRRLDLILDLGGLVGQMEYADEPIEVLVADFRHLGMPELTSWCGFGNWMEHERVEVLAEVLMSMTRIDFPAAELVKDPVKRISEGKFREFETRLMASDWLGKPPATLAYECQWLECPPLIEPSDFWTWVESLADDHAGEVISLLDTGFHPDPTYGDW